MNKLYKKYSKHIIAIGLTCIISWAFTLMCVNGFKDYTFGLFIWLPFVMGACSTLLFTYRNNASRTQCINVSFLGLMIFCFGLLTFAMEGLICILMAAPIGLLFNWLGVLASFYLIRNRVVGNDPRSALIILICSVPCFMSFEYITKSPDTNLHQITTTIEINASPEKVWKNVIQFPQLRAPAEFIFKTGIAYPVNAKITGQGVGAIRNCNFSTGTFVEPITVWNSPHLLKFDVVEQPETMKELSFYNLHPNHIHGYFVSKQGQFKLTSLPNGHTLLEGTTWYYNNIKPDFYWIMWCNYIVHKIHQRVLDHIKIESEKG